MTGIPPLVPGAAKESWRRWANERWAQLDATELSRRVLSHITAWDPARSARSILLYLPLPGEIDLSGLLDGVVSAQLLVTRTPPEGPLTLHPLDVPLERHRFGFMQPVADAPRVEPSAIDVALIPGRAFDRRGRRLGRGAGYFDQFLSGLESDALLVGVCPSALIVDELPVEPHDVTMTHLVSELGLLPVVA